MTLSALVLFSVMQAQGTPASGVPEAPTAAGLVSKMLERYAFAKTLVGRVEFTVTAGGQSIARLAQVQYERPSKLWIWRGKGPTDPKPHIITSDGKFFTYPTPVSQLTMAKEGRLMEPIEAWIPVVTPDRPLPRQVRKMQDIGDVYAAGSGEFIGTEPWDGLDFLIARTQHLAFLRSQWAGLEMNGPVQHRGVAAYQVGGAWRSDGRTPPTGRWEMVITPDGDLLRYRRTERIGDVQGRAAVDVVYNWEVFASVNVEVDPKRFTLLR